MAFDATELAAKYGTPAPASHTLGGPGTELALLLSAAGVGSRSLGAGGLEEMDRWGTDGCRRHHAEIAGWLREEHRKRTWLERIAARARIASVMRAVPPALRKADAFTALVEEAIRRAEDALAPPASHAEFAAHALAPLARHKLDQYNLAPAVPGPRFNASVVHCGERTLLAWRNRPLDSRIYVSELDRRLAPTAEARLLDLEHHFCDAGHEDPRLFLFGGRLHVSFTGVQERERTSAHVFYAELDDSLQVRQVFMPDYRYRVDWEKNWTFFECDGALYAVYSILPHRVLAVSGSTAVMAHNQPWSTPWRGGLQRGGASPVRVGDEFYCFFHGARDIDGIRTYTAGVYTFEARPPFRVTRATRWPILIPALDSMPHDKWANVVYPCGAFLDGARWIVSCGVHDAWIEIYEFDAGDIEQRLEMIA